MIKEALARVTQGKDLSFAESKAAFEDIFEKTASSVQIAAFLVALAMKGETEDEITGAAVVVREKSIKINGRGEFLGMRDHEEPIVDTCGTGGSGIGKFNISTATAFVVAAGGLKVAKHGNRAMSSMCGSADVLEAMGININVEPGLMERSLNEIGIAFLYAPLYHPQLKTVAEVRKDIGVRTIFNILGPLCNPARANYQLLGVYRPELIGILAKVLQRLGVKRAFVIWSKDLHDEISLTGPTSAVYLSNKKIRHMTLEPSSFGLSRTKMKNILVKSPAESARLIERVLTGAVGEARNSVIAASSVCFYMTGKVKNLKEGALLAAQLIDRAQAHDKLIQFREFLKTNA